LSNKDCFRHFFQPEIRDAATTSLSRLTGIQDNDGLLRYLADIGIMKTKLSTMDEDDALTILKKNLNLRPADGDNLRLGIRRPSSIRQSSMLDSWFEGVDPFDQVRTSQSGTSKWLKVMSFGARASPA
jgi:hypothetical protein